ncbi:MAG: SUMF1/EgtB/PvdO family nonheme iron enzyme, partial [Planctomycetes bacterium]|nr:SUMF1/EgtB/PvdO family nonheme iron enzyme [Planctomycetota bacterium]
GEFQNSDSPYGTFDQSGNVWEWNESVIYSAYSGLRGGAFVYDNLGAKLCASYRTHLNHPSVELQTVGFRVVQVPEPGTFLLLAIGGLAVMRGATRSHLLTAPRRDLQPAAG